MGLVEKPVVAIVLSLVGGIFILIGGLFRIMFGFFSSSMMQRFASMADLMEGSGGFAQMMNNQWTIASGIVSLVSGSLVVIGAGVLDYSPKPGKTLGHSHSGILSSWRPGWLILRDLHRKRLRGHRRNPCIPLEIPSGLSNLTCTGSPLEPVAGFGFSASVAENQSHKSHTGMKVAAYGRREREAWYRVFHISATQGGNA